MVLEMIDWSAFGVPYWWGSSFFRHDLSEVSLFLGVGSRDTEQICVIRCRINVLDMAGIFRVLSKSVRVDIRDHSICHPFYSVVF